MKKIPHIPLTLLALSLACSAQANSFIENSDISLELKSVAEKTTADDGAGATKRVARNWAQVGALHLSSGYAMDFIGINAAWYGVLPSKKTDGINNFFQGTDNNGYDKFGASIKLRPLETLDIEAGRMDYSHALLGRGEVRTTPRMYEMAKAAYGIGAFNFTGIYATGVSDLNESGYESFAIWKNADWRSGKLEKRPVEIVDISFEYDNLTLFAAYGQQKDFSNYILAEGSYFFDFTDDLSLELNASYRRKQHDYGNHGTGDNTATMWSEQAIFNYGNSWVEVSHSKVNENTYFQDSIDGTMGVDWMAGGSTLAGCKEGFYVNGVQGTFNHIGEQAVKVAVGYDFDDMIQGLSASIYHIKGWDIYKGGFTENHRQKETGGIIQYTPPALDGLSILLEYGDNHMQSDGEYGMDQKMSTARATLSYTIELS